MVKKERTPHSSLGKKLVHWKSRRNLREPAAMKYSRSKITANRSGAKVLPFFYFRDHVITALSLSHALIFLAGCLEDRDRLST